MATKDSNRRHIRPDAYLFIVLASLLPTSFCKRLLVIINSTQQDLYTASAGITIMVLPRDIRHLLPVIPLYEEASVLVIGDHAADVADAIKSLCGIEDCGPARKFCSPASSVME